MRVVLDSNVLFSALISPVGAPDKIYRAWRESRFELITSKVQLDELRRVSRYPKFKQLLSPHRIGTMINDLHRAIVLELMPEDPPLIELLDPNDAFLYSMAIAGKVNYLVTGDRRAGLLELGNAGKARIVTPSDFCNVVLKIRSPLSP